MKFLSVCETCLQRYYLDEEEVYVPRNMRVSTARRRNPYIRSWADWVLHVQSFCPMCRLECPEYVIEDRDYHIQLLAREKAEIEAEDEE